VALHQVARASAIPVVDVVHPSTGTEGQEIELPGNTRAFDDTPISARTSGYVEHWYADLGVHVRQVVTAQTAALANQRNGIDILRRQLDASVLLLKALGGGCNVSGTCDQ
jgi:hypothetical protein